MKTTCFAASPPLSHQLSTSSRRSTASAKALSWAKVVDCSAISAVAGGRGWLMGIYLAVGQNPGTRWTPKKPFSGVVTNPIKVPYVLTHCHLFWGDFFWCLEFGCFRWFVLRHVGGYVSTGHSAEAFTPHFSARPASERLTGREL